MTAPAPKLGDLLERLEAATGPDRALDAAIFEAIGTVDEQHCRHWCRMDGRTDLTRKRYIIAWAPLYTADLNAVLTLVEEKLPGMFWSVGCNHDEDTKEDHPYAALLHPYMHVSAREDVLATAPTPALALLKALVSALSSESGEKGIVNE